MSSLVPGAKWTTKLSSAGLVYVFYGRRVIGELTRCHGDDAHLIDLLFHKLYENFVEEVDGIDNGIESHEGSPR